MNGAQLLKIVGGFVSQRLLRSLFQKERKKNINQRVSQAHARKSKAGAEARRFDKLDPRETSRAATIGSGRSYASISSASNSSKRLVGAKWVFNEGERGQCCAQRAATFTSLPVFRRLRLMFVFSPGLYQVNQDWISPPKTFQGPEVEKALTKLLVACLTSRRSVEKVTHFNIRYVFF